MLPGGRPPPDIGGGSKGNRQIRSQPFSNGRVFWLGEDEEDQGDGPREWELDELLGMVSHDLLNQQQAALGFLELLVASEGLAEGERAMVTRTMEVLERTARTVLHVRATLVQRERGTFRPQPVSLARALETSSRSVRGAFSRDRLSVDVVGVDRSPEVLADGMLGEMLTQLLLLLAEDAPIDRMCTLRVQVEEEGRATALRFSSQGFALNPLVTDALVSGREPAGRSSRMAALHLIRDLLGQYGGAARMEPAPPGEVGAHLLIRLPQGEGADAFGDDSR